MAEKINEMNIWLKSKYKKHLGLRASKAWYVDLRLRRVRVMSRSCLTACELSK